MGEQERQEKTEALLKILEIGQEYMSKNLSLIEYQCDSEGRLFEPEKAIILSNFIGRDLVDAFFNMGLLSESNLYEDSDFEDCVKLTRIDDGKIDASLQCLTSKLIEILESDRVESIKKIQSESEISELMLDFMAISGAYRLIKLKRDNFANSAAVVVVLE